MNRLLRWLPLLLLAPLPAALSAATPAPAPPETRFIQPLDYLHNHGSCIVEMPGGGLMAVWYRGSGERRADDVVILGSRLPRGATSWSAPFPVADTPGFPDCNPAIVVDPRGRLRLYWPLILANEWHTALLMEKVADRYERGAPRWIS